MSKQPPRVCFERTIKMPGPVEYSIEAVRLFLDDDVGPGETAEQAIARVTGIVMRATEAHQAAMAKVRPTSTRDTDARDSFAPRASGQPAMVPAGTPRPRYMRDDEVFEGARHQWASLDVVAKEFGFKRGLSGKWRDSLLKYKRGETMKDVVLALEVDCRDIKARDGGGRSARN